MKRLKGFDYFASNYALFFLQNESYKTKSGGIITIATVFLFAAFAFYLGLEIFYREKPIDTMIIVVNSLPNDINFAVPFAFLLQDKTGTLVENAYSYLNASATYIDANNTNGVFTNNKMETMKMRYCNHTDYSPEILQAYIDMALDQAKCFDNQNVTLGGDFSGNYVKYINVLISPCQNSSENNFSCASQDLINEFLKTTDIAIAMHHESLSYDSSQFQTPIKKLLIEDGNMMDRKICKQYKYYLQKFIIYSDSGLFISTQVVQTYYQIDRVVVDYLINADDDPNPCLFKFLIQSSHNTRTQHRTYLKLSDVIAQVGGALNVYLIFFSQILKHLYQRKMNEKLMRHLFIDDENGNKDQSFRKINSEKFKKIIKKAELSFNGDRINLKVEKTKNQNNNNISLALRDESKPNISLVPLIKLSDNISILNNNAKDKNKILPEKIIITTNNNNQLLTDDKMKNPINIKNPLKNNPLIRINEDIELKRIKNLKFSLFQHLKMLIPCCYCCMNKNLDQRKQNFLELLLFSSKYFDIVEIVKKLHQFERMKYVIFSKKEIALFNSVSQPSNPLIFSKKSNFITERLKFDNDIEAQKKIVETIVEMNDNLIEGKTTKRLLKLKFNNN